MIPIIWYDTYLIYGMIHGMARIFPGYVAVKSLLVDAPVCDVPGDIYYNIILL